MIYKNIILYKVQLKQFIRLPENSLKSVGNKLPPLRLLLIVLLLLRINVKELKPFLHQNHCLTKILTQEKRNQKCK